MTFTTTVSLEIDGHLYEDLEVEVDPTFSGAYRRASWGYNGGSPEEHPECEIDAVTVEWDQETLDEVRDEEGLFGPFRFQAGDDVAGLLSREALERLEHEAFESVENAAY